MRPRIKLLESSAKTSNRMMRLKVGTREGSITSKSRFVCDDGDYFSHSNLMRIKPNR